MNCVRCHKPAELTISGIGDCCWTHSDEERAFPGRIARRAAFDAALKELAAPHSAALCAELEGRFNVLCPLHGDSDKEEE